MKFSAEIRIDAVNFFNEIKTAAGTARKLKEKYGESAPSETTVRRILDLFQKTGATMRIGKKSRTKTIRTPENIRNIGENLKENPKAGPPNI